MIGALYILHSGQVNTEIIKYTERKKEKEEGERGKEKPFFDNKEWNRTGPINIDMEGNTTVDGKGQR